MPQFKDRKNREWKLELDAPLCLEVKERFKIDLLDLKADPIAQLAIAPLSLVDVLWTLCGEQAKAENVSEADFKKSLGGDAVDGAIEALPEAIAFFFPSGRRSLVVSLQEQNRRIQESGETMAIAKVSDPANRQKLLATMEKRGDAALAKILTDLEATEPVNSTADSSAT